VNWKNLVERVGRERLIDLMGRSRLVGIVNWTMLPNLSEIWEHLLEEIVPVLPEPSVEGMGRRIFFVDLSDPEKRSPEDLRAALVLLAKFNRYMDVILGLNLKEAQQVARVLDVRAPDGAADAESAAQAIREKLDIHAVVVHPRSGAAGACVGESAWFAGPMVKDPEISTGAGDHFNAGFVAGRLLGMALEECLAMGTATSGYYVRHGQSPTRGQLAEFLERLPEAQA
jgi:sugar/nucleoside kinase (ribokinase family)